MEALQFTLSGKDAFFKKPEVNTYNYYTFGQIHKVVLLGMFGAILGYGGYAQKKWKSPKKGEPAVEDYPEFYERLKDIKISIIPQNERGYIPKKIQIFNNSVGYASGEQGGNLIVKEQWLENPKWEIYLLLDGTEAEKIADYLLQNRCVYFPYLGKNDHPADITNAKKVSIEEISTEMTVLSCMYPKGTGNVVFPDDEDEREVFKYEEKLPMRLNGYTNLYEYDTFCFTNMDVHIKTGTLYRLENKILTFY